MIRFSLGELQLTLLDAGSLWLDGGAMFGVVPRALWAREREPDDQNRIRLRMNVLLIDDGRRRTLVDTGAGTDWSDRLRSIYRLETKSAAEILEPAGVGPERIDRVVNTHLHFDHAGGNTAPAEDGGHRASFPNAEYFVQAGELQTARWRNERTRASYRGAAWEPLARESGRLRPLDGAQRLAPYLWVEEARGHTPHMQIVRVEAGGRTLAFLADLVPTASHVPYPYIMGFDLEPLLTLQSKKRVLPRAAAEGWWLVFEHDDRLPLGTLVEREGRLEARPCEPERH